MSNLIVSKKFDVPFYIFFLLKGRSLIDSIIG